MRWEPGELIDAGGDQVVAVVHLTGRAKLSNVETDMTYAVVQTIGDGKAAVGREYATRQVQSDSEPLLPQPGGFEGVVPAVEPLKSDRCGS